MWYSIQKVMYHEDDGAHDNIQSSHACHHIEIGKILPVYEFLDRRFEEQLHTANLDHFLHVLVDHVVLCEKLLVQLVHHVCRGTLEMGIEEPEDHNDCRNDRYGHKEEDFKKIRLKNPESQHDSAAVYHGYCYMDSENCTLTPSGSWT